jgi:glycine betaine/proline transport system permease protein
MDWLSNLWLDGWKIPVGDVAKTVFDWMKTHLKWLFDAMAWVMEHLIEGILWCLQTPHPVVIVAIAVAITWYLQRSWKICLLVFVGFLFILNQGYWKPTTESLTLILASCVVCMGACLSASPPPTGRGFIRRCSRSST